MSDDDPVTELETEWDPDGEDGPLPPVKFRIRLPDSDYIKVGLGIVIGILMTLGYINFQ